MPLDQQRLERLQHLGAARREIAHHRDGYPVDLTHRHPVGRCQPTHAEPGRQFAFEHRRVQRPGGVGVSIDRLTIQRPPPTIHTADTVQDRAMRVKLRIADSLPRSGRACCSVPKLGDDEPARLHAAHSAHTCTSVTSVGFQIGQCLAYRVLMTPGYGLPDALVARCRPQHRHRLRRRERHIECRDRLSDRPIGTPPSTHVTPQDHLWKHPTRRQANPAGCARINEPAVQHRHHLGVDLAGQSQLGQPATGPHPCCLTAAGVIVVPRCRHLTSEVVIAHPGGDPTNTGNHASHADDP